MAAHNSVSVPKKSATAKSPVHSIRCTSYSEYHDWIRSFAQGKHRLLIVLGDGGTGKSKSVETIATEAIEYEGKLTDWNFYQFVYSIRGTRPICLSDLKRKSLRDIQEQLRQLSDSKPIRKMEWHTNACVQAGIPQRFYTANPVIILSNSWDSSTPEAQALETRADAVIRFEPSPQEVHREVSRGKWFFDQEVFDFIGEHLKFISEPSFRHYTQGSAVRKAKPNSWKAILLEWIFGSETHKVVALLLADKKKTDIQRVKEFVAKTGYCERTYWRLKKHFRFYEEKPLSGNIVLPKEPPKPDIEAMLRAANGEIEGETDDEMEERKPVVIKPKKQKKETLMDKKRRVQILADDKPSRGKKTREDRIRAGMDADFFAEAKKRRKAAKKSIRQKARPKKKPR